MKAFSFPEDFALGVSSAPAQIEGGDVNDNWHDWYEKGHIHDGSSPSIADMHYEKWQEDDALMADMGIRHSRMGLSWARLEPEEGKFDKAAMEHYKKELTYYRERGIKPLVTIHHFENPMWFEELGAFEKTENCRYYLRFARYVVTELKDLACEYITVNEPNVYSMNGYFGVGFPPGKNSFPLYAAVLSNMAACHIAAYKMIHWVREKMGYTDTKVSFAMHLRSFTPLDPKNPVHKAATKFAKQCFQTAITRAMAYGEVQFPILPRKGIHKGLWCDFWGVNYYSRSTVSGLQDGVMPGRPINDLGWEIYPEGIVECCRELYDRTPMDIYITENGTCDELDVFRGRYLYDHLKALCESGLPVKRYYHWCFLDNWEWLEGESARFGLVHVNYRTQERTMKKSGEFYTKMIRAQGVTEEMYEEYCGDYTRTSDPQ